MSTNRECLFYENPTFVQGVRPYIQKLTENVKTKETTSWLVIKKVKVAYRSFRIRELFITEFKSQFKRGFTTLVTTRAVF